MVEASTVTDGGANAQDALKVTRRSLSRLLQFWHKGQLGFIAQQVQSLFPDLFSQGPDGYYTLNYSGFAPYLTEAI